MFVHRSVFLPAFLSSCFLLVCLSSCLSAYLLTAWIAAEQYRTGKYVAYPYACLSVCLSACLPGCLSNCIYVCLSMYVLFVHLPFLACLSACLYTVPDCLLAFMHTCLDCSVDVRLWYFMYTYSECAYKVFYNWILNKNCEIVFYIFFL